MGDLLNLDRPLRALSFITRTPWAVAPEMLETIAEIASLSRDDRFQRDAEETLQQALAAKIERTGLTPQALQARRGRRMEGTENVTIRDGVAVLAINGVISRYADFFTYFSGGATLESIAEDFAAALNSPQVDSILLEIDSPGGEASGICEFAAQVYAARDRKRCMAYIEDLGASAAYWIAAAAEEVVINPTARVGSIGVLVPILDTTKAEETRGIRRFTIRSSQSPKKAPDPTTPDGQDQIRGMLDATAAVFVADVARYRGVSEETVLSDFGQGDVLVGRAAVEAGMADRLGDFESVLSELQDSAGGGRSPYRNTAANGGQKMADGLIERALRAAGWRPPRAEGDVDAKGAATGQVPPPAAQDPVAAENERLRRELTELRENQAQSARAEQERQITAAAEAWADAAVDAGNATPAERPGLLILYRQAAAVDAAAPLPAEQKAVLGASLAPFASQVALLRASVGARKVPGGSLLNEEALQPGAPAGFVLPAGNGVGGDDFAKQAGEQARKWAAQANGNRKGGKS